MQVIKNGNFPYYDSFKEFLAEDDICEIDVYIVGLEKQFRIRALDFDTMEKINQLSILNGTIDNKAFAIQTIVHGVIRPRVTPEDANKMLSKNGAIIRELADQIWVLSRITPKTLEAYLKLQAERNNVDTSSE